MELMIDLETMGLNPNGPVVAIGAVFFSLEPENIGLLDIPPYYAIIDLESAVEAGGVMDASTVKWWLGQDPEAQSIFTREAHPILDILLEFSEYLATHTGGDFKIWGNSPTLDNQLLASAYRHQGLPVPWNYRNERDYRTVRNLFYNIPQDEFLGTPHNALHDARHQALHLVKIWKTILERTGRGETI